MVAAPAAADAVARARRMPSLRVGLHLVLVEGRPVLPAAARALISWTQTAISVPTWRRSGAAHFLQPTGAPQLAAEIGAQFEAFRATGLDARSLQRAQAFPSAPGGRRV